MLKSHWQGNTKIWQQRLMPPSSLVWSGQRWRRRRRSKAWQKFSSASLAMSLACLHVSGLWSCRLWLHVERNVEYWLDKKFPFLTSFAGLLRLETASFGRCCFCVSSTRFMNYNIIIIITCAVHLLRQHKDSRLLICLANENILNFPLAYLF